MAQEEAEDEDEMRRSQLGMCQRMGRCHGDGARDGDGDEDGAPDRVG